MGQSVILRYIHTSNFGFLPKILKELCFGHKYSTNLVRGQGESDPKMGCENPQSIVASSHQIWDSYIQLYKIYATDTISIKN